MFWFRKKALPQVATNRVKLKPLYEGDRGTNDLYANDAELRVWIPEPLNVAMKEVAEKQGITLAKSLRDVLVAYLYGFHELLCMYDNGTGICHPPPPPEPSSGIKFSRARVVDYIPGLGKNLAPLKLFVHEKMKADLQLLADKAGLPLSQFVREILTSHYLGHTVWPERNALWTREQQDVAEGWESGRVKEDGITTPTSEEESALEGKIEKLW